MGPMDQKAPWAKSAIYEYLVCIALTMTIHFYSFARSYRFGRTKQFLDYRLGAPEQTDGPSTKHSQECRDAR